MTDKHDDEQKEKKRTMDNIAVALGDSEITGRYGDANAEFLVGYRGVSNETGQQLTRGLKGISEYKVNPKYAENNLNQQAGFSAEVAKTSRDNAQNIIGKTGKRTIRTDDHPDYGLNHPVYDHVEILDGQVVDGSGSQMKFVKNNERLLDKIAKGEGGGKNDLSRYQDAKLDLPTDKVEAAKKYCETQATTLRDEANTQETKGNLELAAKKRQQAENYEKLKNNIQDSGLTAAEARFYREHPTLATALDIGRTSHKAGLEGAKCGLVIGGSISVVKNIVAVLQDDKDVSTALQDAAIDTGKSVALGYGSAVAGSAIKSVMQQSSKSTVRQLSKTSLPTLAVTVCIEVGSCVQRYAKGEIDTVQFMEELGERGSGLLASGMMATLGQIAIPIPVVGALVGGMVGYTMSSIFYKTSLAAFKEAREAKENYLRFKAQSEEARRQMEAYQAELQALFDAHMQHTSEELAQCFAQLDQASSGGNMTDFAAAANQLGSLMGKSLQFETMNEFENFMASGATLIL